jgi:hypoxanthine phosphoribosyltransferase
MERDIKEILINEDKIKQKVKELAKKITRMYKGKELTIIAITNGSIIFLADLIRHIPIPLLVDVISASSYGSSTESSEIVTILGQIKIDLNNRNVLIIDDIFDTGKTLQSIIKKISQFNPKDIKTCVLLEKPDRHQVDIKPDFVCFQIPNEFVVGYGLDYDEKYRNLPYIAILKENVINT